MTTQSKRYRAARKVAPADRAPYPLPKAVELLKLMAEKGKTKFDQSVEIHMRLGVDAKQADQIVRGSIVLPHGIGRSKRVVVFAKGELAAAARDAGADMVGEADLAAKIKEGWIEFDACIASPDMMGLVGPLGKVLGPHGLMPSPRAGTVTADVARVVREYKAGKVEFRNDPSGIVHAVVGRVSFDAAKLEENIQSFINHILAIKPNAVKGIYVKSITICSTMSPSVYVAV